MGNAPSHAQPPPPHQPLPPPDPPPSDPPTHFAHDPPTSPTPHVHPPPPSTALVAVPPPATPSATSVALYTLAQSACWLVSTVAQVRFLFVTPEYDKNNVADAIGKLQSTLAFLDTKMTAMNANVDKYTNEAKRLYARKNKQGAMHQLRLKKMYEREVSKMDSLKFNIESNILHMESVGVMMETVATIKETSHQFQVVSKHVDIAKLEDSIEEMFEQRDTSRDIETILNEMHGDAHEYDEDELLEELETLVGGEDDDDAATVSTTGARGRSAVQAGEARATALADALPVAPEGEVVGGGGVVAEVVGGERSTAVMNA